MNSDLQKLSADLKRIAWWLYKGDLLLASSFLGRLKVMYPNLPEVVWGEVLKIQNEKEDKLKRSERALTLSAIYKTS